MESIAVTERSKTVRNAITNGTRLHRRGVDLRGRDARRFRDVFAAYAESLGGEHKLTEAERALARTAASLSVKAEAMQADVAAGLDVDAEQLVRVSNSLSRVLAQLRARHKPRDATPSLAEYLAATSGNQPA